LEAIDAPLIKSYVFYTKEEAYKWIDQTKFPKVFKLRGGSGSFNVELVKNKNHAKKLARKAFGTGFPAYSRLKNVNEKVKILYLDYSLANLKSLIKSIIRLLIPNKDLLLLQRQKGYIFFQDFIPDNTYDTRVVVVGNKCFAGRRFVRKNDWRASGSGIWAFEKELINMECVKIAFDTTEKIGAQVMAYDFIFDKEKPVLTEISSGTCLGPYDKCTGHWDEKLNWHEGKFKQQIWMIEDFIGSLKKE
jgi:glutathione synthase/RimK-type ligase-like ATP-grasp enzyme